MKLKVRVSDAIELYERVLTGDGLYEEREVMGDMSPFRFPISAQVEYIRAAIDKSHSELNTDSLIAELLNQLRGRYAEFVDLVE